MNARGSGVGSPWVVLAKRPEVVFGVQTGKGLAAVVHGLERHDNSGSRGLNGGKDGLAVGNDEVDAARGAVADFLRLGDMRLVHALILDGAEHDHAGASIGAEGEFGVGDGAVGVRVDSVLGQAEHAAEPVDGTRGVAVAERRDEGGTGSNQASLLAGGERTRRRDDATASRLDGATILGEVESLGKWIHAPGKQWRNVSARE